MGPKYGKIVKAIFEEVNNMDASLVLESINSAAGLKLSVCDTDVVIEKEDVLIETLKKDGFVSTQEAGCTVVLDINLTTELIEEGFVREIVSKIQTMRKDSGLEVLDNINVYFESSETIDSIMSNNSEEISGLTLAKSIEKKTVSDMKEWNINGEKVLISIEKA